MEQEPGLAAFGLSEAARLAIAAHPGFPQAARRMASDIVEHYVRHPQMRRYTRDRGSHLISAGATFLHLSPEGLTASTLHGLCQRNQIASPGRVNAVLAYMRGRGDLVGVIDRDDRRVRRLAPGAAFMAFQRSRILVELRALSHLTSAFDPIFASHDPDDVADTYMRRVAPLVLAILGGALGADMSTLNIIAERDAGLVMLFELLGSPLALKTEPLTISIAQLARRLSVSRPHILKLLADTAADGLLSWRPEAREVTLSRPVAEALIHYFSAVLIVAGYNIADLYAGASGRQGPKETGPEADGRSDAFRTG
jgi:hypothetical protein